MYNGVRPFFYRIGNCAINRAANTERLKMIELLASESGYCPFFAFLGLTIDNEMTIMGTNVCIFAKTKKEGRRGMAFSCVMRMKEECDGCMMCQWMSGTQEDEK